MFDTVYLDYLQIKIKKNVCALKESMIKKLNGNEFIDEKSEITIHDDLDNAEIIMDDMEAMKTLLDHMKKAFFEL